MHRLHELTQKTILVVRSFLRLVNMRLQIYMGINEFAAISGCRIVFDTICM